MPIVVQDALFLGNLADADTVVDSNGVPENPEIFDGTFGSTTAPLSGSKLQITYDDMDGDGDTILDTATLYLPAEPVSYSLDGVTTTTTYLDSLVLSDAFVTYKDGSTATFNDVVLVQDNLGNVFLLNSGFNGNDLSSSTSPIQSVTISNSSGSTPSGGGYFGLYLDPLQPFLCFASDTLIETATGERPIGTLEVGDLVRTVDGDCHPIRWIGKERMGPGQLSANPKLRPVLISAGSLGVGLPKRDLRVSRQHRIMLRSKLAARMFDADEVLIAAHKLTALPGISMDESCTQITYVHILLDRHEIILAEGAPSETLFTGPEAMKVVSAAAKDELRAIFGPDGIPDYPPARTIVAGKSRDAFVRRLAKNEHRGLI